jgi:four helix bundle protein
MHNIAEGFDAGSDAEFIRFLKYSRRSASEVQSELYIALDRHYITQDQFQRIFCYRTLFAATGCELSRSSPAGA